MKPHTLFLNIFLIAVFSFSVLTPEDVSGASPENVSAWATDLRRSGVTPPTRMPVINTTTALPPLLNIVAIAAGYDHTCALTKGGGVKCWGANDVGQLGDGTTTTRLTPVNVNGLASGVSAITAGTHHTCARTAIGGVKCWGSNGNGQLGDGTTTYRLTPVNVSGLASGVSAIDAGQTHTCALSSGGKVKCWGNNNLGQLGDGTTVKRLTPVNVSGLASEVSAITAGEYHTCARISDGGIKCWGYNAYGQLGDGTTTDRHTPVNVNGLASWVSAITAGGYHTCARTPDGGVKCWGWNEYGQLGDGTTTDRTMPVSVSGLSGGISAITAGNSHTCARTTIGVAWCWGYNSNGQLGDGTTTNHHRPEYVSGLANVVGAITTGDRHTCTRISDGGGKCWGWNFFGQLGDGTTTERHRPVDILDPTLTKSYRSTGSQDGWVLESSETSSKGGSMNSAATVFYLGDEASNRQYRTILSFGTSGLPDDAVITKVTLKIKKQGLVGSDPFTTHGNILVDVRKGAFGGSNALQLTDFQAAASKNTAGTIKNTPSSGWYSLTFNSSAFTYINLAGVTQFRLRFQKDDNDDLDADYLKFYSGNYSSVSFRPLLVIQYYVP